MTTKDQLPGPVCQDIFRATAPMGRAVEMKDDARIEKKTL
jgi:hypothetical protein